MKKILPLFLLTLLCTSCYYADGIDEDETEHNTTDPTRGTRPITFAVQSEWTGVVDYEYARTREDEGLTRATGLAASDMTALWIYDYDADGVLLQSKMWEKGQTGWSAPTLQMTMGEHQVIAVASRGTGANETDDGIAWTKPSDTFAAAISVDVNVAMGGTVALPLTRQTARLSVVMTDAIPEGVTFISLTLSDRSMGIRIPELAGTTAEASTVQVDVSSAVGKDNQRVSVFSLTPSATAWTTDVEIAALDADGVMICSVNVDDVELLRGRTTVLTGQVFSQQPAFAVTLDDAWLADKTITF